MSHLLEKAGSSGGTERTYLVPEAMPERPLTQTWMTDDLVAETRRVCSVEYGRVISDAEAVEILTNIKRLAEVLLKAKRGKKR